MTRSDQPSLGLGRAVTESAVLVDGASYFRAIYRAALRAQHSILIAAWQFDPYIQLVYGEEAKGARYPVNLWDLLNALCRERPKLRVCVLAWDYSLVYAFERTWLEMMQARLAAHRRIEFRWRSHPDPRGSHHQKLVVVDGSVAFVGGLDLGRARWDTRQHAPEHPERKDGWGGWYKPFHDIQAAVTGPAAEELESLFWGAWGSGDVSNSMVGQNHEAATRAERVSGHAWRLSDLCEEGAFLIPATDVVISRTAPPRESDGGVHEVRAMYEFLIAEAERSIYLETQYFTSSAVIRALLRRMAASDRPVLSVVLMMPDGADSPKERLVLGTRQAHVLSALASGARQFGHRVGIYHSAGHDSGGRKVPTYIHSKLMIVDDTRLLVGSANLTNRSMGLDTELTLTWRLRASETSRDSLAQLRASLLAEHVGAPDPRDFLSPDGLLEKLDQLAARADSKLYPRASETGSSDPLITALFDPSTAIEHQDWDRIWEEALGLDEDSVLKRSWEAFKQALMNGG